MEYKGVSPFWTHRIPTHMKVSTVEKLCKMSASLCVQIVFCSVFHLDQCCDQALILRKAIQFVSFPTISICKATQMRKNEVIIKILFFIFRLNIQVESQCSVLGGILRWYIEVMYRQCNDDEGNSALSCLGRI